MATSPKSIQPGPCRFREEPLIFFSFIFGVLPLEGNIRPVENERLDKSALYDSLENCEI